MKYFIWLSIPLLFACVPKSQVKKAYDSGRQVGFHEADQECIELQKKVSAYIEKVQADLRAKDAQLKKFKQTIPTQSNEDLKKLAEKLEDEAYQKNYGTHQFDSEKGK